MFQLATLTAYLAMQYAASSPLPQQTSVSSAAAALPTEGATIVSGFVPSPGGPPAETLYAVTASDQTYLAGMATVTATASDGTPTAVVEKDVFVLTNDTINYYQFNGTDYILQAVECDVSQGGTTAICNGTSINISGDLNNGAVALAVAQGETFSGASSGVTAYAPTGTVDVAGVSFATAAPSIVESATAFLTSYLSSVQSVVSAEEASASAEVSAATASLSSDTAFPTEAPETNTGFAAGGFTFPSDVGITGDFTANGINSGNTGGDDGGQTLTGGLTGNGVATQNSG